VCVSAACISQSNGQRVVVHVVVTVVERLVRAVRKTMGRELLVDWSNSPAPHGMRDDLPVMAGQKTKPQSGNEASNPATHSRERERADVLRQAA
jgi:hypothetical protein